MPKGVYIQTTSNRLGTKHSEESKTKQRTAQLAAWEVRTVPYKSLYNRLLAVARCKNPPIPVSITFEDFVKFTEVNLCEYCRRPVYWSVNNLAKNGAGYNLDRKNNNLGYTVDNVAVCCMPCNQTKCDRFTYDEFMVMMTALRNFRGEQ